VEESARVGTGDSPVRRAHREKVEERRFQRRVNDQRREPGPPERPRGRVPRFSRPLREAGKFADITTNRAGQKRGRARL
jgi:hypothetical protein